MIALPCHAQPLMEEEAPHPEMKRAIDAAVKAAEYERVAKTMDHEPSRIKLQVLAEALRYAADKILARVVRERGDG